MMTSLRKPRDNIFTPGDGLDQENNHQPHSLGQLLQEVVTMDMEGIKLQSNICSFKLPRTFSHFGVLKGTKNGTSGGQIKNLKTLSWKVQFFRIFPHLFALSDNFSHLKSSRIASLLYHQPVLIWLWVDHKQ